MIVVHARQRVDRVDAVRDQRGDRRLGGGHADRLRADLSSRAAFSLCHWPDSDAVVSYAESADRGSSCRGRCVALTKRDPACAFRRAFRRPFCADSASPEDRSMHRYRSHTCGALRESDIGQDVRLSGWCHRIRDHGGVLFIDLRDHYGLTQVVADPDSPGLQGRRDAALGMGGADRRQGAPAPGRHRESRPADRRGRGLSRPRSRCWARPANCRCRCSAIRNIRRTSGCNYRFLDLRRERLHQQHHDARRRSSIRSARRMKEQGFFEFQTPILTASSPEGARDFLVPSRLHPGKFYALPQAPQQFKQLIMVSGFDRYFQIAPCFRDEDARADRSPGEFYQLDLEMSFVTQDDVFDAVEPVLRGVFEEFAGGKPVTPKFPRIPYAEAMRKYGTDKPDLRNPIEMQNVTEEFRGSGFKIFASMIADDPAVEVWAIPAPTRRQPRLLRPDELLGAGRGPAGARLYLLARRRGGRRRPARQEHRAGAHEADRRRSSASASATRCSSSPASRRSS